VYIYIGVRILRFIEITPIKISSYLSNNSGRPVLGAWAQDQHTHTHTHTHTYNTYMPVFYTPYVS
jgi:hypothetical protein